MNKKAHIQIPVDKASKVDSKKEKVELVDAVDSLPTKHIKTEKDFNNWMNEED